MTILAFLLAACLDPVQAALVLAIVLAYRGPQPILVAGIAAAVASETVMALLAVDYTWGELMAPRAVASVLQAAALYGMTKLIRGATRGGLARNEVSRLTGHGTTALGSVGSGAPRFAPWHMRAYLRRRTIKLRQR